MVFPFSAPTKPAVSCFYRTVCIDDMIMFVLHLHNVPGGQCLEVCFEFDNNSDPTPTGYSLVTGRFPRLGIKNYFCFTAPVSREGLFWILVNTVLSSIESLYALNDAHSFLVPSFRPTSLARIH